MVFDSEMVDHMFVCLCLCARARAYVEDSFFAREVYSCGLLAD